MKTKHTEITVETTRVVVVSKHKRLIAPCEKCGEEVDWLTVDEAALLTRSKSLEIFRMAELGELHSLETVEGILVVCARSAIAPEPCDRKRCTEDLEPTLCGPDSGEHKM